MEVIVVSMVILLLVVILIAANTSTSKEKIEKEEDNIRKLNDSFFNRLIENESNEVAAKALRQVKLKFENGECLSLADLNVQLGMPMDIAYSKNSDEIDNFFNFTSEETETLFKNYAYEIYKRKELESSKLFVEENAFNEHKIVLKDDEILFSNYFSGIYLMEEKTISRNVTYGGLRVVNGLVKMGNLSYSIQDTKDMTFQDFGRIFVTNKRLIFSGKEKHINTDISINSITDYYLYRDGILICRNNRKNVLLKSAVHKNYLETGDDFFYILDDFSLKLVKMIQRVADKTYDKNL